MDVRIRPLYIEGELVGAAEVFSSAYTGETAELSVKELERLALFDQLTQLPNRRYIDTFLDNQIRDLQVLGIPFGVLMMDLDFFKRVNDDYGHDFRWRSYARLPWHGDGYGTCILANGKCRK